MGLASFFLGDQNPFTQWVNQNGNMLSTIGTGLMQGQNIQHGLQIAGGDLPQARQLDLQQAEKLKADALTKSQMNATTAWLKQQFPDIAVMVEQGVISPGEAFKMAYEQKNAGAGEGFTLGEGQTRYGPDGKPVASLPKPTANNGIFEGTSLDAQAMNILGNANADKNSDAYKWAYWYLMQPKPSMAQTAQGMVPIMTQPTLPPGISSPYPAVPETQPAETLPQSTSMGAGSTPGITVGQPIPGTAPKPTEQEMRMDRLGTAIQGDVATLFGDGGGNNTGLFNALTDVWSQISATDIGGAKPGYPLSSPDYQQAANAIANIAQTYLYAMSGAAAPEGEVQRIVRSVTPVLGESEASVLAKKKRLLDFIQAINSKANGGVPGPSFPNGSSPGAGGFKILGVE